VVVEAVEMPLMAVEVLVVLEQVRDYLLVLEQPTR